jgi:hypothetical protein
VGPWLALYTLGRLLIAAALVALLWLVGLGSFPGLLFGLLLSMPASYVLLRPVRDRLTEALAARSSARRTAKADFRARLAGEGEAPRDGEVEDEPAPDGPAQDRTARDSTAPDRTA